MDIVTLEVKSRSADISAKDVRNNDMIPGVFYGSKQENRNVTVDYQTFRRVFEKAGGNTVLELEIDGKEKITVLVHDLQYDPVTDKFTHIDFKFVDLNKEVTTEIPLVAIGESKAVRELMGTFMQNKDTVTVKCIAKNIPHSIEFDISSLEDFHTSIRLSDLKFPEGVEVLDNLELAVASVAAPRVEEEEEEAPVEEEGVEGEVKEGAKEDGEAKVDEKKEGSGKTES